MSQPVIHIGYHKTGTNWFQRCFYPHISSHQYVRRPIVRAAFLDVGTFAFDERMAAESFRGIDRPPILCEEELSGNIHSGGLAGALSKDMCERLYSVFPNATVVIVIRNQIDMIASVYLQYIKEGGTHRIDRYLRPRHYLHNSGFRQAKSPYFSFGHFDYWPLIDLYRKTFGMDRVKVFTFESLIADPENFAREFAWSLGLDVRWDKVTFDAVNMTYRRNTAIFARWLNRFTYRDIPDKRYWVDIPGFFRIRGKLLRAFNRGPFAGAKYNSRELLGSYWSEYIRKRYITGNKQIAKHFELKLSELGYPYE